MSAVVWTARLGGPLIGAISLHRFGRRPLPEALRTEAVVVAGCPPRPDGSATPSLERRAKLGAQLVSEGKARLLVLTGAAIAGRPSEASVAAALARRAGVPASQILIEEKSTTTAENAREAWRLLGSVPVVVVSDAYHVWRCVREFERYFPRVWGAGAQTPPRTALRLGSREAAIIAVRRWPPRS